MPAICFGPRRVALELGHYRVDKMVVHRLDMATSGVVVMARSDAALKSLHQQASERNKSVGSDVLHLSQ